MLLRMIPDSLKDEIRELMIESLMLTMPASEIANDTPLFGPDGLGLDSIDALELVVGLEKKYGVKMPDSNTAAQVLRCVDTIAEYVVTHRSK